MADYTQTTRAHTVQMYVYAQEGNFAVFSDWRQVKRWLGASIPRIAVATTGSAAAGPEQRGLDL